MPHTVRLSPKGFRWLCSGHLWIYRDDIEFGADKKYDGEIVRVESSTGTFLAQAFFSGKSTIALRLISDKDAALDREFFKSLLVAARNRRGAAFDSATACRLVGAEGDYFPGLIVDHYAGHLSMQILIPGVEKLKAILVDLLDEIFSPASITFRGDAAAREMEGLPQTKEMLKGDTPRSVDVVEGDVRYLADLWDGHKTGAYLDQQANRISIGRFAKGRALDAFCYQGHFSLHLAKKCSEVVSIDSSEPALDKLRENCRINGIDNVAPRRAKVFDELGKLHSAGEKYDVIVLDPPPFARSRKDLNAALKGYRELNRRAMGMLKPGGHLATYSCSYSVTPELFLDILRKSAADSRRKIRLIEQQTQSPDHPIALTVPETHYLKGYVLENME